MGTVVRREVGQGKVLVGQAQEDGAAFNTRPREHSDTCFLSLEEDQVPWHVILHVPNQETAGRILDRLL